MKKKTVKKRVTSLRAMEKRPNYVAAKLMGWDPGVMTKWLRNHDISLRGLTVERVLKAIAKDGRFPLTDKAKRYLAVGTYPKAGAPGNAQRMTIPDKVALLIESVEEHLKAAERCKAEAFEMMQAHYRDQAERCLTQ